jgi:hypothetical protein
MENFFTPENWNFSQYRSDNQFAIISLLADPGILDEGFSYCVTVLDDDHNEHSQTSFPDVLSACQHINQVYMDFWEFKDLRLENKGGSGCSTCVAH